MTITTIARNRKMEMDEEDAKTNKIQKQKQKQETKLKKVWKNKLMQAYTCTQTTGKLPILPLDMLCRGLEEFCRNCFRNGARNNRDQRDELIDDYACAYLCPDCVC